MNEATTTRDDSNLSLIDTSKGSPSTSIDSANNAEVIEKLSRRLRELESENLELGRAIPHLEAYDGTDCTKFITGKLNELEEQKEKNRRAEDRLAEVVKNFRQFRDDATEKAQENEKRLIELRNMAETLENENSMLRDRLRNEESINFHLRDGLDSPRDHLSFDECLNRIDNNSDVDLESKSTARTERADSIREQALGQLVCALFDKLRTTADVFAQIHSGISGDDAQNSEQIKLVEKIKNLKLDLNRSIELYNKKFQELQRSTPSSVENLTLQDPHQSCSKCKNIEEERDTLRAQLNREILLKNECLASKDELDRSFREARRSIEEMRSALLLNNNKIEDLQNKLQRNEYYYQNKYGGLNQTEIAALNEQINNLRKRNLELDAKNEQILKASQRLQEVNREEFDNKDIELQEKLVLIENHERTIKQLLERCKQLETENKRSMEQNKELKLNDKKYTKIINNLKATVRNYEKYFDEIKRYEGVQDQNCDVLEVKIDKGDNEARH